MKNKNLITTLRLILVAVIAAFCASPTYAAISAYEPFNYNTGALGSSASSATGTAGLTTAGGFTGNWAGSGTIVSGLSYNDLPVANNALSENAQNEIVSLAASITNGTYYVGFLFTQNTTANQGNNGGNGGALDLCDSTGKGITIGQLGPNTATAGNFEVCPVTGKTAAGTAKYTGFGNDTYGTTYLIVVKITGTGSGWSGNIWINPPLDTATPGTATGSFSGISQFTFSSIAVWNAGGGNADVFDEIRVGTTYGDAIGFATAPSAPSSVTATGGTSQATLNWSAVAGATSYNVLQGTSSGGETSLATGVTSPSYTDSTAANGTQYFYEIQAVNTIGVSANSSEVNATPMAAPTGFGATAGNNFVALSWNGSAGATSYNVKRSTTSGSGYTIISTPGAVTGTAYTDNSAVAGTTYFYVVSATNTVGESLNSSQASALPFSQPPTAPTGLLTVPTNSQVTLSWTAGTGDVSYNVKRSTTSGSGYTTISPTGTVTGSSYTDSTAVNGNIYYYVVSGTNSSGESVNSSQASAALPPAAPTGLGATAGANQIVLSWVAPSGTSGATSYNVKRSTNSGSGYVTISTAGTVTGTAYTDTTAFSGTTYFYVVSGVNATGQGANSIQATTTPSGPPQVPTVTMITNYTTLTLSWAPVQGAPAGYVVSRSTTSGTETVLTNQAATSFTDTSVVVGTQYFYTVAATNSSGSSANSAEVTGTPPGQPFAYESFNYGSLSAGTPTTAAGFTGNWTVNGSPSITSGLTYPNLTTANNALQSSSGGDSCYENLSTPILSGTVWMSFIFYQGLDNGGNRSGLALLNSSGSGVMFCYHQFQTAIGTPCITAVSNYNVGFDLRNSATTQTYAQNNLYVLRLMYSGSGTLTNIAVYTDPTAGQNTAPAADFTVTSGLSGVGAITTIGLLNPSGVPITVDEWNIGTSFGAVVPGSNIPAPTPPTGLKATPGDNHVTLTWNAPAGATSYNVLQSTTSGAETTIATGVTTLNYTDNSAVNGTKYYYVVQAANTAGTSANSVEVSATPTPPPAPPAPTGLIATPGDNTVSLSWNPSPTATSYNVLQSTTSGAESLIAAGLTTTNYTDSSVSDGTKYYYVVQAVLGSSTSTNSAEVSATPSAPPAPPAPTGLNATPGDNTVSLTWNASAGATSYNVLQGTSSGGESVIATGVTGTGYTDNSVSDGTTYFYEVQAVNGSSVSTNSAEVSTVPAPPPAPLPPTGVTATPGNNYVIVTWNPSAGASSYNILQGTTSGGESLIASGINDTNFTDFSAADGTKYYYVIQAVNGVGTSGNSAEVSTTPGTAPVPVIQPVHLDSAHANLVINVGTQTGFNYYLLTSTNLAPPAVWTTNNVTAGTGGTITDMVPYSPSKPKVFVRYFVQ